MKIINHKKVSWVVKTGEEVQSTTECRRDVYPWFKAHPTHVVDKG